MATEVNVPTDSPAATTGLIYFNRNPVINRVLPGGNLDFHDAKTSRMTRIGRNGHDIIDGNVDWIMLRHAIYKFTENIRISPGNVAVVTVSPVTVETTKPATLELWITGPGGHERHYTSLPGEPRRPITAEAQADPAPGVTVSTEALADVVFTSSLESSLSTLSISNNDNHAEQQAVLDTYKQALNGMLYRHEITMVEIGSFISFPGIHVGPLTITISYDPASQQGSVTASVLGISLGTAKFSPSQGADIGIDVWLAKAGVQVNIRDGALWLEAYVSVRFGGSAKFGPAKIWPL